MKNHYVYSNIDNIIIDYENGLSTNKISNKYNCNSGTIYSILKANNINIRNKHKFNGNISDYEDIIVNMFNNQNISAKQISKILSISSSTILRILHKNNCQIKCSINKNSLLKNKLDIIISMRKNNLSIYKISKIVHHSCSSIRNLLKNNGYNVCKYKYTIDESFFETIDTQDKAYIWGLLASDGNVTKAGKIRISLQESDKHILYDVANAMKYSSEPTFTKRKNARCKNLYTLNIDRIKMYNDLLKLGIVPKKSLILRFPTEEQVPYNLIHHAMRGFFDGDGSVSLNKNNKCSVSITTTDKFCKKLYNLLKPLDIYPTNFYYRTKGKPYGSLFFGRHVDAKQFLDWIYLDANLKINRKYEQYLLIK